MKEALIFVADTHINSRLGLSSPNVMDDDGGRYELNVIQQWLWHTWQKCIFDINDLTHDYKKTLILDGDISDLDIKSRSAQMISQNPVTVLKNVDQVLEPILTLVDRTFIVRGTEAHTGLSAWSEEQIGHRIRAVKDVTNDNYSWWQIKGIFSGVKFDVAHHGSMGYLPWTYSNGVMRLVQEAKYDYLDWNEEMPDVIVRAHQHRFSDSGETFSTRGVFLPCWQYKTAYLYRLSKANNKPHIGSVVFLCEDGQYKMHVLRYEPKKVNPWMEM